MGNASAVEALARHMAEQAHERYAYEHSAEQAPRWRDLTEMERAGQVRSFRKRAREYVEIVAQGSSQELAVVASKDDLATLPVGSLVELKSGALRQNNGNNWADPDAQFTTSLHPLDFPAVVLYVPQESPNA